MTAASPTWRRCSLDGTWDTAFGKATGRPAIAELARSLRARGVQPRPRAVHLVTNIVIQLNGDHAQVRSNWMVVQNSPHGPQVGSGGAYEDEMVKQDGHWLFRYARSTASSRLIERRLGGGRADRNRLRVHAAYDTIYAVLQVGTSAFRWLAIV